MRKPRKWTLDKLKEESSKFNRRIDFQNKSSGAYQSAKRQGLRKNINLN